jgi:rhamnose utilization protein RhaD (predicted bifunctional aldolase and dehydrogenase)/NAD(P)-dependent dehydrogenase (short-subunit alcohol dehydrogenase family)
MRSLWDDREAAGCQGELALRVYTSRLLGRDRSLVLHGGGNTSVKLRQADVFGEMEDVIHVKGSGWDLETIAEAGFAPLRLAPVRRLAELPALSDPRMVNELVTQSVRAGAPVPSVEAILHAILAPRYVDHTHADAVVTVTNTADGAERVRQIYGDTVLIVPYVMPGFELARAVHQQLAAAGALARMPESLLGMVLLHHGIFSFADTARESYERMIHLVDLAERHLQAHGAWVLDPGGDDEATAPAAAGAGAVEAGAGATGADGVARGEGRDAGTAAVGGEATTLAGGAATAAAGGAALAVGGVALAVAELAVAALRREICGLAGRPLVVAARRDARSRHFVARDDLARVAQQGPATPDHVLRTKRLPLVGRDVAAYAAAYRAYFNAHAPAAGDPKAMLDAAPRIVLDPELGLLAVGGTAGEAAIAAEIYQHTMDVIERAERLGGYRALPAADLFAVEYWDLEQAKLRRAGEAPPLRGEVALVTGAASGIGKACVEALLARGAAVAALDVDPRIEEIFAAQPAVLGRRCDVTDEAAVAAAVGAAVAAFGGLDVLILNAGIFPDSRDIAALGLAEWRAVTAVNLDANVSFLRLCHPLLRLAPRGGRVAVIGSKNVPAPGRGVAAYSASKAALQQLARVAALEWGGDGIRVNIVHPNAVFDTAIWTEERLAARAAAYHVDVETYRRRGTVLGVEVRSRDVAEVAVELCGPRFSRTTGAQVPVDGGNERVI